MYKKSNLTKAYYEKHAEAWMNAKTNSFYHEREFTDFAKHFKKGARILDIGCAYGIHVPLFLGIGRALKYEGLDISKSFLKIAGPRYPQLSFHEGDILDKGSLPKKKYDGFWAAAVLMHIPEEQWPQMMENIERIMRSGATGYVTVPQKRFVEDDLRHFTLFTKQKFTKLISARNWRVLKSGFKTKTKTSEWLWFIVKLP